MANLNEEATWESGIYQWETSDPAQGGASGIMNTPTRQLANRTLYLRERMAGYEAVVTQNISVTTVNLASTFLRRFNILDITAGADVIINPPAGVPGNRLGFLFNSTTAAGSKVFISGQTLEVGDAIEFVYTAANTLIPISIRRANEAQLWVPTGAVLAYAKNTPPAGYLACNGAAVSRSTYAALFAAIGTTFGAGNGTTTFNLPDLRAEFIRGWDNGRGVDNNIVTINCSITNGSTTVTMPTTQNLWAGMNVAGTDIPTGATIVSVVNGTTITISAPATATNASRSLTFTGRMFGSLQIDEIREHRHTINTTGVGAGSGAVAALGSTSASGANVTGYTGGDETRPRNVALLYCIKF